jgi:hypothetical protein
MGNNSMADTPENNDKKQLVAWLGVITSVLTILGWFGATNWHQFEAWLKSDGGSSHVGTSTPTSSAPAPAPAGTTVSSSRPSPALDPGCTEATQVLASFNASQKGAPKLTSAQTHTKAIQYRGFANNLNNAAANAKQPQVSSAINAMAIDARTLADDFDAYDLDAASHELDQLSVDGGSLLTACKGALIGGG